MTWPGIGEDDPERWACTRDHLSPLTFGQGLDWHCWHSCVTNSGIELREPLRNATKWTRPGLVREGLSPWRRGKQEDTGFIDTSLRHSFLQAHLLPAVSPYFYKQYWKCNVWYIINNQVWKRDGKIWGKNSRINRYRNEPPGLPDTRGNWYSFWNLQNLLWLYFQPPLYRKKSTQIVEIMKFKQKIWNLGQRQVTEISTQLDPAEDRITRQENQ